MNKEIFISHRSLDKDFADLLETFLTTCGVPSDVIFCSSLPGNDVQCEISKEIKESLKSSKLNIVLLSEQYYQSPYCQQEAGIIWFSDVEKIVIALPEINENLMEGFLNNEYKIRRMDNRDNMLSVSDMVKDNYTSFTQSATELNRRITNLISQYKLALKNRQRVETHYLPETANELERKIISGELSDGEMIVLKYFYDTQKRTTDCDLLDVQNWLNANQVTIASIYDSLQLLIEDKIVEFFCADIGTPLEYGLVITFYRNLLKISKIAQDKLNSCLNEHKDIASVKSENEIDNLITKGFTNEEILLIKYIVEVGRDTLFCGWQIENEVKMIKNWEDINNLDNILSLKYDDALTKLFMRKFLEVSQLTSGGNPKEYRIKESFLTCIKKLNTASIEKIGKIMQDNIKPDYDDLPF